MWKRKGEVIAVGKTGARMREDDKEGYADHTVGTHV